MPAPFYASLGSEATGNAINARVQENVDALVQLIDILHEWVSPTSLKVVDDEGRRVSFCKCFPRGSQGTD